MIVSLPAAGDNTPKAGGLWIIAYPMCGKDKLFVCKVGASVGRGVGVRAKVAEYVQDA